MLWSKILNFRRKILFKILGLNFTITVKLIFEKPNPFGTMATTSEGQRQDRGPFSPSKRDNAVVVWEQLFYIHVLCGQGCMGLALVAPGVTAFVASDGGRILSPERIVLCRISQVRPDVSVKPKPHLLSRIQQFRTPSDKFFLTSLSALQCVTNRDPDAVLTAHAADTGRPGCPFPSFGQWCRQLQTCSEAGREAWGEKAWWLYFVKPGTGLSSPYLTSDLFSCRSKLFSEHSTGPKSEHASNPVFI